MLKIRRPLGRLIFNMGIAIPGKTVFLIETDPWMCHAALTNEGNRADAKTDQHLPSFFQNTKSSILPPVSHFLPTPPQVDNYKALIHWARVTHICICKPYHNWFRLWLVAWTAPSHYLNNVGILLTGAFGINFSEMLIEIQTFSFKEMHLKMLSGKWGPSCLGLNVVKYSSVVQELTKLNIFD